MEANNLKCCIRFLLTNTLAVTEDSPSHRVVEEFEDEKKFFLIDFLTCIGIMTLSARRNVMQLKKMKQTSLLHPVYGNNSNASHGSDIVDRELKEENREGLRR